MNPQSSESEFLFYSTVDDELFDELVQLEGESVVHCNVWDDSMVEGLERVAGTPAPKAVAEESGTFDIDLYLADGIYFELYSVAVFDDPDADPWIDRDLLEARLLKLTKAGGILGEIAVDEEEGLVLVLHERGKAALYLSVGGWVIEEWDELPV